MRFLLDNKEISLGDALRILPNLAIYFEVLKDKALECHIDDKKLIVVNDKSKIFIDIDRDLEYHKKFFYKHSIYKEPLAKAIGLKKGQLKPKVVDTTGGFLSDSLLLLSFGLDVSVCERNPLSAMLIQNAIDNTHVELDFSYGCITDLKLDADVAYYDPMYSHKNEKTSPKKHMKLFRDFIGVDEDSVSTAKFLIDNYKRVVIKRSVKAPFLIDLPSHSISGKSTRYDVYMAN
ncbi:MAG: class I SAM-dependent methyltransferase [Bacteriovoracaceae bacterium]|jgi:hypothetical protein|nr:class I SAM-dependent methyltransferase [Bacteriovoracaceae bacterium]